MSSSWIPSLGNVLTKFEMKLIIKLSFCVFNLIDLQIWWGNEGYNSVKFDTVTIIYCLLSAHDKNVQMVKCLCELRPLSPRHLDTLLHVIEKLLVLTFTVLGRWKRHWYSFSKHSISHNHEKLFIKRKSKSLHDAYCMQYVELQKNHYLV